jgi:Reverse transcriptase (RNA-dependent DNA polymerase)
MSTPNKTSPLDIFPIALLKSCSTVLPVPIAHMVYQSFANGIFPAPYKSGLVTPLVKKADLGASDLKNFRSITNLCTISKIIEWLALFQLKPQITGSPNYCHHQSAYRSAHSTKTALLKIVNDVVNRIDEGSVVVLVGLDISAAFNTVNHELLLNRLSTDFGVVDVPLRWIRSYLSGRTFFVQLGSSSSPTVSSTSGVPTARS